MNTLPPEFLAPATQQRLARQVAQATGTFENMLFNRMPRSISVVSGKGWMTIHLQEDFDTIERRLATDDAGREKVEAYHRFLFDNSLPSLRAHVLRLTGVRLEGAVAHIDAEQCIVFKTFSTNPAVDLFVMGQGISALGITIDHHHHADYTIGRDTVLI